jgi:hypothetical protein
MQAIGDFGVFGWSKKSRGGLEVGRDGPEFFYRVVLA